MSRTHSKRKNTNHNGNGTATPSAPAEPRTPLVRHPSEQEIRESAYSKWEAAGRPPGDGVDFWLRAESELRS